MRKIRKLKIAGKELDLNPTTKTFQIGSDRYGSGVRFLDLDIPVSRSSDGDWQIDDESLIGSTLRYDIEIVPISQFRARQYGKMTVILQIERGSRWIQDPENPSGNWIEIRDGNIKVQNAYIISNQFGDEWSSSNTRAHLIANTTSQTLNGKMALRVDGIFDENFFMVDAWRDNESVTDGLNLSVYNRNSIPENEFGNFHELFSISIMGFQMLRDRNNSEINSMWNSMWNSFISRNTFPQNTAGNRINTNTSVSTNNSQVIFTDRWDWWQNNNRQNGTTTNVIQAATTTQAGVMTAADKAKLNGIQAGAQVNTIAVAQFNDLQAQVNALQNRVTELENKL